MKVSINNCPPGAFLTDAFPVAADGTPGNRIWVPADFIDTQGTKWTGGWYVPTSSGFRFPRADYNAVSPGTIYGRQGTGYAGLHPDATGLIDVPPDVESFDVGGGYIGFRPKPAAAPSAGTTAGASSSGSTIPNLTGNTNGSSWTSTGGTTMDRNAMLTFIESLLRGQAVVRYNVAVYGSATAVAQSGSPAAVLATPLVAGDAATNAQLAATDAFRAAQKTIQDAYSAYLRTEQTISFIKSAMTGDPMLMLASILATGGLTV